MPKCAKVNGAKMSLFIQKLIN